MSRAFPDLPAQYLVAFQGHPEDVHVGWPMGRGRLLGGLKFDQELAWLIRKRPLYRQGYGELRFVKRSIVPFLVPSS